MTFNDKLIFLMDTAHVKNRVLADSLNVDPSMISLLRTGRRGKPRNQEFIRSIADFFSVKCNLDYQKEAIAEVLGQYYLKYYTNPKEIAEILYDWLSDDNYIPPNQFEQNLNRYQSVSSITRLPAAPSVRSSSHDSTSVFYFGLEGKGTAMSRFFDMICSQTIITDTIYISSDEDNGWFIEADALKRDLAVWMELVQTKDCHLVHILPPPSSPIFTELISAWLPLYLTGNMDVYFYPRTRDRIFRRSMFLLPGVCGVLGSSVEGEIESTYTVFSQNPQLISAVLQQYKDYLAKCQRTFVNHITPPAVTRCLLRFMAEQSDFIQYNDTLSSFTLPLPLIQSFFPEQPHSPHTSNGQSSQLSVRSAIPKNDYSWFTDHLTIDICRLASAEDIRNGKVFQYYYTDDAPSTRAVYTPESYISHLRHIILLMKSFPNYYFVPMKQRPSYVNCIMVKENRRAVLINRREHTQLLEIAEPPVILPFYEYLISLAESAHYSGAGKLRIIHQLENLIRELESDS